MNIKTIREQKQKQKNLDECLFLPNKNDIKNTNIYSFYNFILKNTNNKYLKSNNVNYDDLYHFSLIYPDVFYTQLIAFFELDYSGSLFPVNLDYSFDKYLWFPNVKMNFAQNLLKRGKDSSTAITSIFENGMNKTYSYKTLQLSVAKFQSALLKHLSQQIDQQTEESLQKKLKVGDVLACYMPNIFETIVAMLSASASGITFTSTSCDFGVDGVVDRFGQCKPSILVSVTGYYYNGKYISLIERLKQIQAKLKLKKIVIVNFLNMEQAELDSLCQTDDTFVNWQDFIDEKSCKVEYKMMPFAHPLYIMYSSGTTGKPKCIVHSQGGTLLQHIKELGLHTDLKSCSKILYFTTCGWMMWNWLVSSLYFGANVFLYEGSPAYPNILDFLQKIDEFEINIFGTSPKFLKALENNQYDHNFKLEKMTTLLSTGAPLLKEQFHFVYNKIKQNIILASISGGTDIIGCFMLANPLLPVYAGEIQSAGLGMDIASFDLDGDQLIDKEGELVCKKNFPSRPIYFLNDDQNNLMRKAYFSKFKDVWHHGDYITITSRKTIIVHGRSDATLNPAGVRIGTAEIYRQVDQISFVEDSICVGKQLDGEVKILLFVKLKDCQKLSDEKIVFIKNQIKKNTTPRHIPFKIFQVTGIPYTMSGKKMEILVTKILAKKTDYSLESVSNPECLKEYKIF